MFQESFQWGLSVFTTRSKGSSGVSRMFQGSFRDISGKFLGCFREVSTVFQGRFKGSFKWLSLVFKRSSMVGKI